MQFMELDRPIPAEGNFPVFSFRAPNNAVHSDRVLAAQLIRAGFRIQMKPRGELILDIDINADNSATSAKVDAIREHFRSHPNEKLLWCAEAGEPEIVKRLLEGEDVSLSYYEGNPTLKASLFDKPVLDRVFMSAMELASLSAHVSDPNNDLGQHDSLINLWPYYEELEANHVKPLDPEVVDALVVPALHEILHAHPELLP